MDKKEEINPDEKALQYFGKAYLKIPRIFVDQFFGLGKTDDNILKLHGILFVSCNYMDGYVCLNGEQVLCHKGEYFTTYEHLASWFNITPRSARRYMDLLVKKSLVEVRTVSNHICVRVCGYAEFTEVDYMGRKTVSERDTTTKRGSEPDKRPYDKRKAMEENLKCNGHAPRLDLLKGY